MTPYRPSGHRDTHGLGSLLGNLHPPLKGTVEVPCWVSPSSINPMTFPPPSATRKVSHMLRLAQVAGVLVVLALVYLALLRLLSRDPVSALVCLVSAVKVAREVLRG